MYIEKAAETTEELFSAVRHLIPQLGIHKKPPSREVLTALINSESSVLLVAWEPDKTGMIVGMLTLVVYRVPTGIRSVIEDIVVDENYRRRGIAAALIRCAVDLAREAHAEGISLTSIPEREAANLLYQKFGFQLRKTNPYIYHLK